MKDLSGRVAVVTGGANGIGLGLARRFLQEGMGVAIADNSTADPARAEKELAPLGEILSVAVDVADGDSVQRLADAAVERFGAVHVLCNNAGVGGLQIAHRGDRRAGRAGHGRPQDPHLPAPRMAGRVAAAGRLREGTGVIRSASGLTVG